MLKHSIAGVFKKKVTEQTQGTPRPKWYNV